MSAKLAKFVYNEKKRISSKILGKIFFLREIVFDLEGEKSFSFGQI